MYYRSISNENNNLYEIVTKSPQMNVLEHFNNYCHFLFAVSSLFD